MSDLVTIELWKIHEDPTLLAQLHALQIERANEERFTGGERSGMRLSTSDPVRRVKEFYDKTWRVPFDKGVGFRGHLIEDYLQVALTDDTLDGRYQACGLEAQVAIPWHAPSKSRSAFDWVVKPAGKPRIVSCKSSVGSDKPTKDNERQERRMMSAAGYPAGTPFEIWVVDPGTFRAVGPYCYELEQADIDAWTAELAGVDAAWHYFAQFDDPTTTESWNDEAEWLHTFGLESSSGAFRVESLDASAAIEKRVYMYLAAKKRADDAKRELDTAKSLIRKHVDEQLTGRDTNKIVAYSAEELVTFAIDKRDAMRVTTRPHVVEGAA